MILAWSFVSLPSLPMSNVSNFIYHYCLEVFQLVLLIKFTLIVLTVSQIILNSTCWPAMKIAVKLEAATYAPSLSWHVCLPHYYLYIFIYLYHVMYTIYFVSHHVIAYAHVYYSLMFNNVILHMLMFIIHLCL